MGTFVGGQLNATAQNQEIDVQFVQLEFSLQTKLYAINRREIDQKIDGIYSDDLLHSDFDIISTATCRFFQCQTTRHDSPLSGHVPILRTPYCEKTATKNGQRKKGQLRTVPEVTQQSKDPSWGVATQGVDSPLCTNQKLPKVKWNFRSWYCSDLLRTPDILRSPVRAWVVSTPIRISIRWDNVSGLQLLLFWGVPYELCLCRLQSESRLGEM